MGISKANADASSEFIGFGARKALKYAGNSTRSFTPAVVKMPVIAKGPSITTIYGVMTFFLRGWKMVG